ETDPVSVRSGLAEARNADVDEPRIVSGQPFVVEAPFGHLARAEILDQHVALHRQPAGERLAAGLFEIERQGLLVAALDIPPQRVVAAGRTQAPAAELIALAGRLDLDDLGAELGPQSGAERAGDQTAHLQHPQPGEWPGSSRLMAVRLGRCR